MPSKDHRAASRQAQLRKQRRGKGTTRVFEAGPTTPETATKKALPATAPEPQPERRPTALAQSPARPARRSRQAFRGRSVPASVYLASELRRIGMITMVICILLAVASFALGS